MDYSFVTCPYCGRKITRQPGQEKAVICPSCEIPVPLPDVPGEERAEMQSSADEQQAPAPSMPAPPPPAASQYGYSAPPPSGGVDKIRLIGIFNLIAGIISLAMALLFAIVVIQATTMPAEIFQRQMPPGSSVSLATIMAVYGGLGVLAALSGATQLIGGISLLRCKPYAATWGYIAALTGIISFWLCCAFPLTLASGIYTMIVLADMGVKQQLGRR